MTAEPLPCTAQREHAGTFSGCWLFSAPVDLSVFLGSALLALAALAVGYPFGGLQQDRGNWTWIPAVLLIDVAHVWATGFRTYLDPEERRRRPLLYTLVPIFGLTLGIALYSEGELVFWRCLAYLAVFHFVRQQYGWVMLYRARRGEQDRFGRWSDTAAIYLATGYPLVYWHCHLPRHFQWFLQDDFVSGLNPVIERLAAVLYVAAVGLYVARSAYAWFLTRRPNPGKDIIVLTTAVCWYVGIIALDSDYAFTVTNVITHGVPYFALVYWYRWQRQPAVAAKRRDHLRSLATFLGTLWVIAYVEEMFWDRCVWHERGWLFGGAWDMANYQIVIVPLLALPQFTHYILDGFIWRRRQKRAFSLAGQDAPFA